MLNSIKRQARRVYALAVNDRRPRIPYSYSWLNNLTAQIVWEGGALEVRPQYVWGVVQAAALAKQLGEKAVSVVEFGVAGGNGLIALEQIAARVSVLLGIEIHVYGFDTGAGLPPPTDFRDLPNLYAAGDYAMDVPALKQRLRSAKLILGPIAKTVPDFLASRPSPLGFISLDVDFYCSSVDALAVLDSNSTLLLPRVHLYLDDVLGLTFGDHNGERLAVAEFNAAHSDRKISAIYGLRHYLPWPLREMQWADMMFMAHIFDHVKYGENDGLVRRTSAPLIPRLAANGGEAGASRNAPVTSR